MKRVALVLAAAAMVACVQPKPLPILGKVPEFELTSQANSAFDSKAQLDGHIWVANFIYTTCDGPCPMMSSQMRQVQLQTASTPDLKLVSFTVDPQKDTPPVLAEYAKHFKYDPARWNFLTGAQARLNDLGLNGFKLNAVDGSMTHSTRFVLVDRKRQIRGYYTTGDDNFMRNLMHDIRQLQRES